MIEYHDLKVIVMITLEGLMKVIEVSNKDNVAAQTMAVFKQNKVHKLVFFILKQFCNPHKEANCYF